MGYFQKLLKRIGNNFKAKGYTGIWASNELPNNNSAWNGTDFLTANEISLYLNRALEKRAQKVADTEWVVKDAKGDDVKDDKIINLIYKPNDLFTGREFWKLYQKYYDLVGEVYIYKEQGVEFGSKDFKIKALHLLMPTLVKPIYAKDGTGKLLKYEYKAGAETKDYEPEDIIFIYNPNPKAPLRGQSLITAGINAIKTEEQISTYHSKVLENGGKVDGVFTFKTDTLTEDQLKDLKDKYKKEYGGAKKAGTPLFIGGDANYTRVAMTPDELSFLEAKKMTLEDICILTGVPKSLLASTNDVKFDNAEADRSIFLAETIKPLVETLKTNLDEKLLPKDKFLSYKDPVPENVDQTLKKIENGIKNYYMTINEARAIQGLDPIDGGDVVMHPFNLLPLGETKETDKAKSVKTKENEPVEHPLKDPEIRRVYSDMQIKRMDAAEGGFLKVAKAYFEGQRDRVLQAVEPKGVEKNLIDDALNINLEIKIGKEMFGAFLLSVLEEAGSDAMTVADSSYDFQISAQIASWLESRQDIFLRTINETSLGQLQGEFTDSLAAGESRDKLVKRIRNVYDKIYENRAPTIARTEIHAINQYGTYQGYKQAGLPTKIWVAVIDERTRDSHVDVDGEEVPINTPFSNGLMYPGDTNGPAEEVINCRCSI